MIRSNTAITLALVGAMSASAPAFAQRAVEATNFALDLHSNDSDTSGSTSTGTLGGTLSATLPIGSYFGASLAGGYSTSRVRTGDVLPREDGAPAGLRPSCSFENLDGEVSLFARRPTLGKLEFSYGIGELSADCSANSSFLPDGGDKLDTDRQEVDLEFYLGNFTFGGRYTTLSFDGGDDIDTTEFRGSWYPIDSLKIELSGNDQYEEEAYGILFEHQPEFLGDGFAVQLGYARTDGDPSTRTISLGLSYFFGTRVSLKDRDRFYR